MPGEQGGHDGSEFVASEEKREMPFTDKRRQTSLARSIERFDGQTVGVFPDVVSGLAKVGEFDQIDIRHVVARKADGTPEEMVDPTDAVLSGLATSSETLDFILSKLIIEPPRPALDTVGQKEQILKIWKTAHEKIQGLIGEQNNARITIKRAHETAAGAGEQFEQFRRGEGEHAVALKADLDNLDQTVLSQLKVMLQQTSQEFASIDKDLPWKG